MRLSRIVLVPLLLLAATLTCVATTALAPADATVRSLTTSYSCSAVTPAGTVHGTSKVSISVNLPTQVRRGHLVAARPISLKLTVPANLLSTMRSFGVTALSATGKASYRVGSKAYPIRNLVIARTAVPASGGMTLKSSATASAFTPMTVGRFAVRVPTKFTSTVTVYGGLANGQHVTETCGLASGAPSKLGTLTVVS
jgi:hypothetical protein